ncbi:unnamed protein product [Amaranthus hypochondriacus]
MSAMNVKIDKFTGRNSFSLWQIKMRALLKQQGLWAPLSKQTIDAESAEMAAGGKGAFDNYVVSYRRHHHRGCRGGNSIRSVVETRKSIYDKIFDQ